MAWLACSAPLSQAASPLFTAPPLPAVPSHLDAGHDRLGQEDVLRTSPPRPVRLPPVEDPSVDSMVAAMPTLAKPSRAMPTLAEPTPAEPTPAVAAPFGQPTLAAPAMPAPDEIGFEDPVLVEPTFAAPKLALPVAQTRTGPEAVPSPDGEPLANHAAATSVLPDVQGSTWWVELAGQPLRPGRNLPLTLDQLAVETLFYSEQIRALRVDPMIRETQIVQAESQFDPLAFVDAKWFDRDEPVGNILATGGKPRLLEDTFTENIGIRRKNRLGGTLEFAQRMILQDSNSDFFTPRDQSQTRLAISATQPLLRGAGRAVNESVIVLAQHDTRIAWDEFATGLQERVFRVGEQYWQLYLQRSLMLQQQRHLERARSILGELESRQAIDAVRSQIERAKAKVATREAAWLRASAEVKNAEARLRALINSPQLCDPALEIVPAQSPRFDHFAMTLPAAKQTAVTHRPEIDNLLTQIRASSVQLNVACNNLLPSLALVVETYVNGLNGNYLLGRSLGDQFSKGAPSYSAGLVFEMPIGNRRARAQLRQRQLELARLYHELNAAMADLATEVEVAVREVDIAHAELKSRMASLSATAAEVDYLYQRWTRIPGHDQSASLFLEDLLDAEDRLVNEEERVATSQARFSVAQVELKRALGMLVIGQPCGAATTVH